MGLKAFLKLAVKQDAVFVVNNENRRVLVVIDRIKPIKDVLNIQAFPFVFAVPIFVKLRFERRAEY